MVAQRRLSPDGRLLMQVADESAMPPVLLARGRLFGDERALLGLAVMEELAGIRTAVADPWLPHMERWAARPAAASDRQRSNAPLSPSIGSDRLPARRPLEVGAPEM